MKRNGIVRVLGFGLLLLMVSAVLSSPSSAQIGIGISVRIGPPALPVYEQPICPGVGYLWTPGYWAWSDDDGYYWVPGTWVEAPQPGLLWTPGYWGWNDGLYVWNAGYWGPHVGFYGGINYGFGYGGEGFYGGEWRGGAFFYNTAVMHVNTTIIRNVYVNRTVIVNNNSHVAFNGGEGGVAARPTPQQEAFAHEQHVPPVAAQVQQEHAASQNRALFARENHGRPAIAATAKPGEFSGHGVVAARAAGAAYHAPAMSPKEARASAPAANRPAENRPAENRPAESRSAEKRPAESRPAENRPTENRAADNRAKAATHPFTPPNKSNTASRPENSNRPENAERPANNNRPATNNRPAPARTNGNRAEKSPSEGARSASEPRAENKPSAAPRARESTPRESAPRASAPRESAPKEASHSAPKPQKQAAAPKKESAPPRSKEERK